jgi:hypothetical protein
MFEITLEIMHDVTHDIGSDVMRYFTLGFRHGFMHGFMLTTSWGLRPYCPTLTRPTVVVVAGCHDREVA